MVSGAQLTPLIPIRNMNRAIKFYTKALGGRLLYRGRGAMRDSWASVKVGNAEAWLITPSKQEKRTLAYSVFVVKNIKAYVGKLQQNGVKFQRAERMGPKTKVVGPIAYEPFGAAAFFKDSEGNVLMIWQNTVPM